MADLMQFPQSLNERFLEKRIAQLERDNQQLRHMLLRVPITSAERGAQLFQLVTAIASTLHAAGLNAKPWRAELAGAVCDVLYGNAGVDLPRWD